MYKPRVAPYKAPQAIKKQDDLTPEIKSHDIMRTFYPLNRCGSKQVIVGADPKNEFSPVMMIGRIGWTGIRLSPEALKALCDSSDYINAYFDGQNKDPEPFQISATENIDFKYQYGRNLITLSSTLDSQTVVIAKPTWSGLVNLLPAINHEMNYIEKNKKNMKLLFIAYVKFLSYTLVPPDMNHTQFYVNKLDDFAAMARRIHLEDLQHGCDKQFNVEKCFYELQAFCTSDMYSYLPYV